LSVSWGYMEGWTERWWAGESGLKRLITQLPVRVFTGYFHPHLHWEVKWSREQKGKIQKSCSLQDSTSSQYWDKEGAFVTITSAIKKKPFTVHMHRERVPGGQSRNFPIPCQGHGINEPPSFH
jgi:hypothetical protein